MSQREHFDCGSLVINKNMGGILAHIPFFPQNSSILFLQNTKATPSRQLNSQFKSKPLLLPLYNQKYLIFY